METLKEIMEHRREVLEMGIENSKKNVGRSFIKRSNFIIKNEHYGKRETRDKNGEEDNR